MTPNRAEIDDMLQALDEALASTPEGEVLGTYALQSTWFYDVELATEDIGYAATSMAAIRHKYEIDGRQQPAHP